MGFSGCRPDWKSKERAKSIHNGLRKCVLDCFSQTWAAWGEESAALSRSQCLTADVGAPLESCRSGQMAPLSLREYKSNKHGNYTKGDIHDREIGIFFSPPLLHLVMRTANTIYETLCTINTSWESQQRSNNSTWKWRNRGTCSHQHLDCWLCLVPHFKVDGGVE